MKLLFKQRLFSWFDSYDIYDEAGNSVYVVKGQLSWGHKLVIYDAYGNEVGMVVQKVLTFLPKFEIYKNGSYIGCLSKEFSFLTPHYNIDYNGWHIDGTIMEWDYSILNQSGYSIARVSKELFHIYNKHNRSYFEALEVKAEKMAKKYDCAFVDNEMPYGRVPQGHPVIVDYFYHEEIRGTENTGKRNR